MIRYEPDSSVLVGGWSSVRDLRLPVGARLPITGSSATARVRAEGVAVRIDDYESFPDGWITRPESPHMSAVAAPVKVGGEVWGNVGVVSRRRAAFLPGAEHRLREFAELVGVAVTGAHARSELSRQAITDPLTGLTNRRGFSERLDDEVRRSQLVRSPLALVMLDVDHFKAVNDLHGHAVGDAVLRELSDRLDGLRREGDLAARIGGEEFALILPATDGAGARAIAERLRGAMAGEPFPVAGPCTVSLGVAACGRGDDADSLMSRADSALYRAKESGRDRVVSELAAAA
ncbi:MAG: diguanylate cyclase [Miltoncostaeaceae bacterium]